LQLGLAALPLLHQADNSKCKSNVKEALKKLRSEVASMVALMAMQKKRRKGQ